MHSHLTAARHCYTLHREDGASSPSRQEDGEEVVPLAAVPGMQLAVSTAPEVRLHSCKNVLTCMSCGGAVVVVRAHA